MLASCFCSSAIPFGVRGGACSLSVASEQSISENRFFYFRYSVRQGLCSQSSPCTLPRRLPTKVSSPACHRSTDLLSQLGAALRLNCCGWFISRDVGRYSNNAKDSFITAFGRDPPVGVCFFSIGMERRLPLMPSVGGSTGELSTFSRRACPAMTGTQSLIFFIVVVVFCSWVGLVQWTCVFGCLSVLCVFVFFFF